MGRIFRLAATLMVTVVVGTMLAAATDAAGPECDGKAATMTLPNGSLGGVPTFYGTPGDDVMVGTSAKESFLGGSGHDRICGGGGDDYLDGGGDVDRLFGQEGNDRLFGGFGRDDLFGGLGDDDLEGYEGRKDRCVGGDGADMAHKSCEEVKRVEQRYS